MTMIRFEPWGLSAPSEEGDSLLDIALENNIPLPHACGGDAACSTCAIRVMEGTEWISPVEDLEEETLDKLLPERDLYLRLACQTRVKPGGSEKNRVTVVSVEEERSPSS